MASTREIRRRVRSVRNIAQITRAMEMVAASRMRRAQNRVLASRPYTDRLREVIADISAMQLEGEDLAKFPLLMHRDTIQRQAVILITPDKGLTGPLNSNILRRATRFILHEANTPVDVIALGMKGRDFMIRTGQHVIAEFTELGTEPSLDEVRPAVEIAIEEFLSGRVDAVQLIYPRFVNTLSQVPEVKQILPIVQPEQEDLREPEYIIEPGREAVLNELLPRYVEMQVYEAQLESIASEFSARMVAMRSASDNARELQRELTLTLNKARQAQITNEVAEISAGANASRATD
jgi:F-type H+-transporting ATPase subunit gamma